MAGKGGSERNKRKVFSTCTDAVAYELSRNSPNLTSAGFFALLLLYKNRPRGINFIEPQNNKWYKQKQFVILSEGAEGCSKLLSSSFETLRACVRVPPAQRAKSRFSSTVRR